MHLDICYRSRKVKMVYNLKWREYLATFLAATQINGTTSDGVSVDALADGQLEVNLLDLGVSAEDIAAMRRIDARIEEARRAQQQALEA